MEREISNSGFVQTVDARVTSEIGLGGFYQFGGGLPVARAVATPDVGVLTGPLAPPADTALTALQAFNLGLPAIWQQGFGNPSLHAWQHNLGIFGQVSWKVTPRLTLDLGARLNYDGEPEPFDRNISLSPRLGFAWDAFGKGRTVIRGGIGTFYAPVGLQILAAATLQSGSGQFLNLPSRTLQDGRAGRRGIVGLWRKPRKLLFGLSPRRMSAPSASRPAPISRTAASSTPQKISIILIRFRPVWDSLNNCGVTSRSTSLSRCITGSTCLLPSKPITGRAVNSSTFRVCRGAISSARDLSALILR